MRRRAWPILVVVAVGLLAAPAADASKKPPRAELRGNGQSATAPRGTHHWRYESGEKCAAFVSDSFSLAPHPTLITVAHRRARPRIVFLRDHKPRVLGFRAARRLDEHGDPRDGRRVRFRLLPKRRDDQVAAWVVRFRVNVAVRPFFDLRVKFPRRGEGFCREGGGSEYSFAIGLAN